MGKIPEHRYLGTGSLVGSDGGVSAELDFLLDLICFHFLVQAARQLGGRKEGGGGCGTVCGCGG